ncbi:hypothetical protein O181_073447 [Austropuccinia psidii MF-1]|uniref:Transposase domain-containing protein n=1 Tax=Austropuccinia psidii MF-1 TaxID=1389203 RepID=A0A9Q3FB93_9BASI|nr:hypothetical protein [Austropuccinia psidii MF-1]
MELCTCPSCAKYTITKPDGTVEKGLLVHRSTRNKHWRCLANKSTNTTLLESCSSLCFDESENSYIFIRNADPIEEPSDDYKEDTMKESEIAVLVLKYISWLNLECGLSKENSQKARDQLIKILEEALKRNGTELTISKLIPRDIRTIIKNLGLEVSFEEYVCCSKCFSLYHAEIAPDVCVYQVSATTQPCGVDLFHPLRMKQDPQVNIFAKELIPPSPKWVHGKILPPHKPRSRIPKSILITQSLTYWLRWFLNVSGVEETMEKWHNELESQPPVPIIDVAQGAMWKTLFQNEARNSSWTLAFSLFIDWFNPLQNKLAGRQVSMGVIALNCLNLPPRLRYQSQYTFLSGIIPGPMQPNMFTISNVLGPLVNELLELRNGIRIHTPKYPKGCQIIVKLAALMGDMVATHKVGGFMSHSATRLCSWCEIVTNERQDLKLGKQRTVQDVRNTSYAYHELESQVKKEDLAKRSGIRWSELNRLPYWDPVLNIMLGVMHNWFEGVLKHQFMYQWGFDWKSEVPTQESSRSSESDFEEMDWSRSETQNINGRLQNEEKKQLKCNIDEVVVPKGVTRVPAQLGTSQCGKLKASE